MSEWKKIDSAPEDELILMMKRFPDVDTPCIVVGEVVRFKGNIHHLWRGPYDGTVKLYKEEVDKQWDEKFTYWQELNG